MPQPRGRDPYSGLGLQRAAPEPRGQRTYAPSPDDDPFADLGLEREDNGFDPVATGLRVLPGVAGSFFGPIGGALGSAGGELAAELYEGRSINPFADNGINPTQIALQGGIGAIPGAKAFQGLKGFGGLLARTGVHTGVGATIGGVTAPLVEEVEREGIGGLNVFDLEEGVTDKMAQGAKWGAGFGAVGGLGMEGLSKYLSSRGARRAGTIDEQFDPNFDARYKRPPVAPVDPNMNAGAGDPMLAGSTPYPRQPAAPDLTAGIPAQMPTPGEIPPVVPAPFSRPAVTPEPPMPLMSRPARSYDMLDDELMGAAPASPDATGIQVGSNLSPAAPEPPNLPPEIVQVLQEYGVEDDLIRTLTADDAVAVVAKIDAERALEGLDPQDAALFEQARAADPSADPAVLRQNLDLALETFYDQQSAAKEGLDPDTLMKILAERGGLSEPPDFAGDQWNRKRRPNAELQRLKEINRAQGYTYSGKFGTALDVPGVFPKEGLTVDQMVADLRSDPRFAGVETPNDLLALIEDAFTRDNARGFGPRAGATPRLEDLKLPRSMQALEGKPLPESNPLDDILEVFARDEAEQARNAAMRAELEAEAPGEAGMPNALRDLRERVTKDPDAVSGGRNLMRRLGEINSNRIEEPDSLQRMRAGDTPVDPLEDLRQIDTFAPPPVQPKTPVTARYAFDQPDDLGGSVPMYLVEGGPRNRSTVSAQTLEQMGVPVPPRTVVDPLDALLPAKPSGPDPAPSSDYLAVKAEADQAARVFADAQKRYRSREIGDAEFLDARRVNDAAQAKFDEAFEAERGRPAAPTPKAVDQLQDVLLPGAEDVRNVENPTPQLADAPFSLENQIPQEAGSGGQMGLGLGGPPAMRGRAKQDPLASMFGGEESGPLFKGGGEAGAFRPGVAMPLAGAGVGGATGAASIDEDDTFLEKAGKVVGGAVVGAGVGAGVVGAASRVGGTRGPSTSSEPTSTPARTSRPAAAGGPPRTPPPAAGAAPSTITPPRGPARTLPKYAGDINVNLERIQTIDDAKMAMDEIARTLRPSMEGARRGQISQDLTRQMAAESGLTVEEFLRRPRGSAMNAETLLAARELNAASARSLADAANAVRQSPTPENYTRLMATLQRQIGIQEQITGATAEAGRALAQFRMMANDTISLPELNELVLASGGPEALDELARRIQQLDPTNLRAMNQFARGVKNATVVDKVYEAWMNALLSGPLTHVANTVSNGLTATTHPIEKTVVGLLDLLRAKASGTPQERFAREGAYAVVGLWKGLGGGLRAGLQSALTDTPTFGIGRPDAVTPGGKIGGTLGHVVRGPTKALMFEDEFFKNIVYSADLHARAVRTAAREGLTGRAVGTRVAEILQNPDANMRKAAQSEALYRTFNTPMTNRWEKHLMGLRSSVPGARWIVPFLRTPINVAKFGLERTPLHLADIMVDVVKGKLSLQDLEEESAKLAVGATVAMGVAAAYQNGMITGGGSPDRSKHATQAITRPDYSVKVGDNWYSFQRLEPLGISLGLVADFMETLETGKQDVSQLPAKLLYSFSKNLQSKTFLKGLSDFFNVMNDYGRYGDAWINREAGTLVPTAVAQFNRARDPIARKTGSIKDALVGRGAGGEHLPPMIDVFGKPLTSDMGFAERLVSPVQRKKVVDDPLVEELNRLGITLSVPSERLTVKDRELSVNDKSTLAQARGRAVKTELDDLLGSASFQRADDEAKRERIERAINQARDAVSRKARVGVRRNTPLTLESLLGVQP